MGKPSKNKRGFGCPSFKVVAEALHGSPFTVAMLLDCWSTLFPKQSPSKMQIAMLLRGDAQDAVYLIGKQYANKKILTQGNGCQVRMKPPTISQLI